VPPQRSGGLAHELHSHIFDCAVDVGVQLMCNFSEAAYSNSRMRPAQCACVAAMTAVHRKVNDSTCRECDLFLLMVVRNSLSFKECARTGVARV
jgi:hypothetical protein